MLAIQGHQLLMNGKHFFYQADTCWSAFTNTTLEEWNYYLDYRKKQGFNVIQINILRQWDASTSPLDFQPFPLTGDQTKYEYDFKHINDVYFDRAEKMLQAVIDHHMIPALVLLWSNYVPGTWPKQFSKNNLFPYELLESYVSYVTERFKQYHPIYYVSGDTDFPDVAIKYYQKVLDTARQHDPNALYSFHIQGTLASIPSQFSNQIDFFTYQSGHDPKSQDTAYKIPLKLRAKGYTGPIIDSEPCYEQITISGEQMYQERFSARDVRRAAWSAVLSGADAGITYGAHGIWMWQRFGETFGFGGDSGFDQSADWRDALHFTGANDIHYLSDIMRYVFPNGLEPCAIKLKHTSDIRIACDSFKKRYVIFLPSNTEINVAALDLKTKEIKVTAIDLAQRFSYELFPQSNGNLPISPAQEDSLLIIELK
ncbi:apiosidase-like domain-containing protein [Loigolactobacillus jiayinensis]|uniref:DUF4038 domain-containing protein n=1 Tax=Loigolactobacillus jiayinensis TaxID=2486016 RepID=A0ABW1RB06_9LACO|nr:DUF4038 domain-containing protein [Loigolactobacillus jiayinensis]